MARLTRLNLGCGPFYWPGWINHDSEIDLRDMPYESASVDEICAVHLFEHLHREQVDDYLREWHRVLKQGKLLILELPSLDKIIGLIQSGERDPRLTLYGIFGRVMEGQDESMLHRWSYTNDEITELLKNNGFDPTITNPAFHVERRDMRIEAKKL